MNIVNESCLKNIVYFQSTNTVLCPTSTKDTLQPRHKTQIILVIMKILPKIPATAAALSGACLRRRA